MRTIHLIFNPHLDPVWLRPWQAGLDESLATRRSAALPGLMRAAGQGRDVMMRPQKHEKALPARIFRWRGVEHGPEVTTFRIADCYGISWPNLDLVGWRLTQLPEGIEDTMCFVGVGDQGVHDFRFRFTAGLSASDGQLEQVAVQMQRPPALAETTRGMPPFPIRIP